MSDFEGPLCDDASGAAADVLAAALVDDATDDGTAEADDGPGATSSFEQPASIETTTIDESARRLNIGAA